MAATRKPAKSAKKKSSARKRGGGRGGGAKPKGLAVPPPDDPLARHEEEAGDRVLVEYDRESGATTLLAMADPLPVGASPVLSMAQLRIDAIRATQTMPAHEPVTEAVPPPGLGADSAHFAAAGEMTLAGEEPILSVAPVAGTSNWVQLGPAAIPKGQTYGGARVLVTGRVTSIAIHPTLPTTIYCGTAQGGVWKTTNAGVSWDPMSDNELSLAIGAVAIDPSNPQVVYAGTGEANFSGDSYYGNGVLKTTNGGASWTMLATPTFTGARFARIAITPGTTTRLFAATTFGLYRSLDAGVTWTQMSNGIPVGTAGATTDVCIDPVTPTTVYAAVWGQGIYKSTNASAATPAWTKLTGGLPASGFTRIALGISQTSPQTLYTLIANVFTTNAATSYLVDRFLTTTNGGTSWTNIPLPGGNIGTQGFYNLNVFVDLTTPNVAYLSGISLWKAVGTTITEIGANIHPDNHAFAMHPTNPQILYAGNDGGIYVSTNGGAGWSDSINKGLCITQFEFIANHPASDAVVLGGTQDNGTEQFRNDAVFYHSDDGDGGYTAISQTLSPDIVLSTYYGNRSKRSTQAGKFGTWTMTNSGLTGAGLFYPPMVMDRTNSNNVAFGTNLINLDTAQGTLGWPTKVSLPGLAANSAVSAIDYVNGSLIYVGTKFGEVYVLRNAGSWTATKISAPPLPPMVQINDIAAVPGSPNTVIVIFGGFNIPHVWRGTVSGSTASWTDISGSGMTGIPNIPCDALVIDPVSPTIFYVATDVAVYRSVTSGGTWSQFSNGLPNCAVFDLALQPTARVLRAATHGRGLWERKLDVASAPNVDLYFRDHLMSTARILPSPNIPAGFEDPLQYVTLGMPLWWWMCADIKVDVLQGTGPAYQFPVISSVDYLVYETQLQHMNPHRGELNRVYVQVHNRGFQPGSAVTVKILYADASAGLPPLPADFWPAWPGNAFTQTFWKPVGNAKTIVTVSPTQPAIVEFDWTVPPAQASHSCMLVIMDSPSDPIPAANKVTDIGQLVTNEKRVGLKNLQIINAPPAPPSGSITWYTLDFHASPNTTLAVRMEPGPGVGDVMVVFPKDVRIAGAPTARTSAAKRAAAALMPGSRIEGFVSKPLGARNVAQLKRQMGESASRYELKSMFVAPKGQRGRFAEMKIPADGARAYVGVLNATERQSWLTVVQESNGRVTGGNTFIIVRS